MNKIIIPTILAFSVLVVGIFAFIPVQNATTVHPEIIAAIENSFANIGDPILLDLENKTKLSSDIFTSGAISTGGNATVTIRALDGGEKTTFNLKECYLTGTVDNDGSDDVQVTRIIVDGKELRTGPNFVFTSFGPWTDAAAASGQAQVEVISGLGFDTGLGADDTITLTVRVDFDDRIDRIFCIAFVQNRADLQVTMVGPPGGD